MSPLLRQRRGWDRLSRRSLHDPRNPGGRDGHGGAPGTPPRALVVALVLACASLMVLDGGDGDSPVDSARGVLGEVFGPVESGVSTAIRPVVELPTWFESRDDMRAELASLQARNSDLQARVRTSGYDRNRLDELDGLTTAAKDLGRALVPARVVAVGGSQSFSDTVTIDAGSRSGLAPDMTVINNDGLVGRILRVTRSTATVLLVVDSESTVGGRIGESMELGFLHGRGEIGGRSRIDMELVDERVVPNKLDTVVTWGSDGAGPYVAGVPVGEVRSVYSSLRDSSQRVVVEPFVDFASLDLVGVVVPSGSRTGTDIDRGVLEADGSVR